MNVLFLTIGSMNNLSGNGLYIDLINELKDKGNNVYILCPNERRNKQKTYLEKKGSIHVLRVRTGNITKTNLIEKGISTILIESQFINAINKYYKNIKFDLVLFTTPPVTFEKVINYIKKRDKSLSYLILKDIFPQNAVDLEILKKGGLVYQYFRRKEDKLYAASDFIGCTSNGNIEYILENNPRISPSKVELFPNSIRPRSLERRASDRNTLRRKYNIPLESTLFVYGGNIGKPQGIEFIKEVAIKASENKDMYLLIMGSGTDFLTLSNFIKDSNLKNVNIIKGISPEEYWEFLTCCDVGLVFLDRRFTVPNTPARLTYYMEAALPILAATDKNTDIKEILQEANCGYWTESGDINKYFELVEFLIRESKQRKIIGENGRLYLEKNLVMENNYETLFSHFKRS